MTLVGVAVKNMRRNLFRAGLTAVAVAVAMLAFLLLRTVLWSWNLGSEQARQDRLATRHRITFAMTLPRSYYAQIRAVPGVAAAAPLNWFAGRLPGRESEFFASLATDESLFDVYDEIDLPAEQKEQWRLDRQGAIVGAQLARQFGWKVGDRVTLNGTVYPGMWQFNVAGIYTSKRKSLDQSTMYFHWKYINESDSLPAPRRDRVGWIVSRIADSGRSARIAADIDRIFDDRSVQTYTMSERALTASFIGMLSTLITAVDVASLVVALIMMLVVGNTIAMAVRERTREYGALRAIGFMPRHLTVLVVGEAIAIGVVGALLGIAAAYGLINESVGPMMEDSFPAFFPYFRLAEPEALKGLIVAVAVVVAAALIPAYRAGKLDVVDALRWTG